jgi:putative oxidoreductase
MCYFCQGESGNNIRFKTSFTQKISNYMNAFLSLGRWLFPIPFAVFGLIHVMDTSQMADRIPTYLPVPIFWVYLAGAGLVAAATAMLLGKYDKLAATLLAVELLLFVLLLHLPKLVGGDSSALAVMLKDLSLSGAAMLYAQHYAKDR